MKPFDPLPPAGDPAAARRDFGQRPEVPVLLYHRVVASPLSGTPSKYYVTVDELRRQWASLRRRGFQPMTFDDIRRGVRVAKPVVLTFDDGYREYASLLSDCLAETNARAVIFCMGDSELRTNEWDPDQERSELLTPDDIRALHDSGRVEIGSHGWSHRRLPTLDNDELHREVGDSKSTLEKILAAPVRSFAYPHGKAEDREVEAVRAAGYNLAVVTSDGPRRPGDDWFRVRRISIGSRRSRFDYWRRTSGYYHRYRDAWRLSSGSH